MSRAPTRSTRSPSRRRILLVEDHQDMREAVTELLETDDRLEVWAAAGSAEDALGSLRDGLPDLAVIDLDLPGMDGLELAAELHRRAPRLPMLILSSHSPLRYEEAAREAGARRFLAKERAAHELVGTVRDLLRLPAEADCRSARPGRPAPSRRPEARGVVHAARFGEPGGR